jgi:hypothetical protein
MNGYGQMVGQSPEGYPIYLYTDPQTRLTSYVVLLPDGRAYYSDQHGRIVSKPVQVGQQVALTMVGGAAGFLIGGPPGAVIGALAGLILSALPKKPV